MSSVVQPYVQTDLPSSLLRKYDKKRYVYTAMVTHGGTVVAFAMDHRRRIFYTVLDLDNDDAAKGDMDAAFWLDEPCELPFPTEIRETGYGMIPSTLLPTVQASVEQEVTKTLEDEDKDHFLSSTARLSALGPFQVFSDGSKIYVFRQAIEAGHTGQVFLLKDNKSSASVSRPNSDFILDGSSKIPLVNGTLLCDIYVLVGTNLKNCREVRFRRSRSKTEPAGETDSLGASDMNEKPFYTPTYELAFVRNIGGNQFSVIQLPTAVSGVMRWQVLVQNNATKRIDGYNIEVSKEGLFNLQGTQLYTSPSSKYRKSVLERGPGTCPYTKKPLIPVPSGSGHAKTCIFMNGTNTAASATIPSWTSDEFTLELWIKPDASQASRAYIFASDTPTHNGTFEITIEPGNPKNVVLAIPTKSFSSILTAMSSDWMHLAVSYDRQVLKAYVNGKEVASKSIASYSPYINCLKLGCNAYASDPFKGSIDECRIWNRVCSGDEIVGQSHVRLTGSEPGLVSYWRFDEGSGSYANDMCSSGVRMSLANVSFRSSDCPIGDTNGMIKASFSVKDRIITGGVNSCLYFQQEKVISGYGDSLNPMKKQARVMMVIGTTNTSGDDKCLVCIDAGVSREGKLAQFPDTVQPSDVVSPQSVELKNIVAEFRSWKRHIEKYNALPEGVNGNDVIARRQAIQDFERDVSKYDDVKKVPLKIMHWDASGLSVCGGILKFADTDSGAHIFPSATGEVRVYFRDSGLNLFNSLQLDTTVKRVKLQLSSSLALVSRTGGTNLKSALISNVAGPTCTLAIHDGYKNVTETWTNVPRNAAQLANILNGMSERPSTVLTSVSNLNGFDGGDLKKSLLVSALTSDDSGNEDIQAGSAQRTEGKDSSWIPAPVRTCFSSWGNSGKLSLAHSKVLTTAAENDLSVEVWTNRENYSDSDGFMPIVHHNSAQCGYTLALERVGPRLSHHPRSPSRIIAGVSNGSDSAHEAQKIICSEPTNTGKWVHHAVTFKQSYGLAFSDGALVNCGTNNLFNIAKDLMIEVTFKLGKLGTKQGLIGKGNLYQLLISLQGKLQFVFAVGDADPVTIECSRTLVANKLYRAAVTRKVGFKKEERRKTENRKVKIRNPDGKYSEKEIAVDIVAGIDMQDIFNIDFYLDGAKIGETTMVPAAAPSGNDRPLQIGCCEAISGESAYATCTISEVRLWNTVLAETQMSRTNPNAESGGLTAWWKFEEGTADLLSDVKTIAHGKLIGPKWVKTPDPEENTLRIYRNGIRLPTFNLPATSSFFANVNVWGDTGFFIASRVSHTLSGTSWEGFTGEMDEIRVWNVERTNEELNDNMFSTLKGETKQLMAYYGCNLDPSRPSTYLYDESFLGNNIALPVTDPSVFNPPTWRPSYAPIGEDSAIVTDALVVYLRDQCAQLDEFPSVCEYSDLQKGAGKNPHSIFKRCYSFIQESKWCLVTGYKVGELITEWVGQAQFNPQVMGFLEGAPPVPIENLAMGLVDSADDAGKVEVIESEEVTYTIGSSKERSWNASFKASAKLAGGTNDLLITAPLGFGLGKQLTDVDIDIGAGGEANTSNTWGQEDSYGRTRNQTRSMTVATGGGFEAENAQKPLNSNMGRLAVPGNSGIALVQSRTADIFALRLAHTGAVVSFRMQPNPDIPPDWNIIPFPINPMYTKQGTLDGRIGYDATGAVVTDPDYIGCTGYGEYSYYKPTEAYRLQNRIRTDEKRMEAFYSEFEEDLSGTAMKVVGSAAGAAAGLLIPGAGPKIMADSLAAGIKTVQSAWNSGVSKKSAKRDIVNTYVWTADGGFFAETTELSESHTEVKSGSFELSGGAGAQVGTGVEIFSIGIDLEFEAALGGGMSITKTKSKDSEKSFSLNAEVNVPGILQKYAKNQYGKWVGVFQNDQPVVPAGKVDAYRFKTFYLDANSENFEDLFSKVIDPTWLNDSTHPNAMALRNANEAEKKPPCWRVFHRVTFVSRILPEVQQSPQASLPRAMKSVDISSDWQLISRLDPLVKNKKGNMALFSGAIRKAVAKYLPQLTPHVAAIIEKMALYYGMQV